MSYFEDMTDYEYANSVFNRPGTKNVGWLTSGQDFNKAYPDEDLLDMIWDYCAISVAQTRGIHECEFCPPHASNIAERKGQKILLGSAEIRVFSEKGDIYAAPNLIYHYVSIHHYRPPEEFIAAL